MNQIISQLSQIEAASVKILADTAEKKKELTASYEERMRRFDEALTASTEESLTKLRSAAEAEEKARADEQEKAANASISCLEEHYQKKHGAYVDRLFRLVTEV